MRVHPRHQGLARDAEQLGRRGLVASRFLQGLTYDEALDLCQECFELEGLVGEGELKPRRAISPLLLGARPSVDRVM